MKKSPIPAVVAMVAAISAVPCALAQRFQPAATKTHYTVVVAEDSAQYPHGRQLCNEMAANLNSAVATRAPICERPHNRTAFPQFTPLRWRFWSTDEFLKKWTWLNQLDPDLRFTTENAGGFAAQISREESGVSEIVLPAPFEGQSVWGFIRVGRPDQSRSIAGRRRHDELVARLKVAPSDYPVKLRTECGTRAPIAVSRDKTRANDQLIPPVPGESQLWVYRPEGGAPFVFAQYWDRVSPSFKDGDLITIDPEVCLIHYSAK